jgi:hypothetical protein
MPNLRDLLDPLGELRYGVPTSEKERIAVSRALPGAPEDPSAEQDVANRYAAGYLFAQQHPEIAPRLLPIVSTIKALFGTDPDLQSWAHAGMNRALQRGGTLGDLVR